ncbi:peptide ABC transporter ATP-binding protein [Falsiroseomonas bella]|uniref:Peptide ABC transporter ATP-binding protein n=1 Tax=Falsiroseomonas bella TaxID=2184016 RepID=A0A317FHT9_9PROT|nr:ABC transporter ATP-binding protein [Falsiroseomonas bella]PWS38163.1 peptide ABC transporter ATP-binding protein [Falsiroseomonas bella]
MSLLSVQDLAVSFGPTRVLEGVSFDIAEGEVLGVVGESGSGKSMTALAIMGLLPIGGRAAGRITFQDRDLLTLPERAMQRLRGDSVAMIFQEPMSSLNPVLTIGEQIAEVLRRHRGMRRRDAHAEAVSLLKLVEIAAAERRVDEYPHQLSGGMRQRAMIAIALACRPKLLIADEPTTALDATVQAGILDLLRGLRRELGMAVLLITHDLGVVSDICERVVVMYAGRVAEAGPAGRIFEQPAHPYTRALLAAIPRLEGPIGDLPAIPGVVPSPADFPKGCRFAPRCAHARPACEVAPPVLRALPSGTEAACIRAEEVS